MIGGIPAPVSVEGTADTRSNEATVSAGIEGTWEGLPDDTATSVCRGGMTTVPSEDEVSPVSPEGMAQAEPDGAGSTGNAGGDTPDGATISRADRATESSWLLLSEVSGTQVRKGR